MAQHIISGRPTIRRVRNRGWEPVKYVREDGTVYGWIFKRGTKLIHIHIQGVGDRRVALAEEQFMTALEEPENGRRD